MHQFAVLSVDPAHFQFHMQVYFLHRHVAHHYNCILTHAVHTAQSRVWWSVLMLYRSVFSFSSKWWGVKSWSFGSWGAVISGTVMIVLKRCVLVRMFNVQIFSAGLYRVQLYFLMVSDNFTTRITDRGHRFNWTSVSGTGSVEWRRVELCSLGDEGNGRIMRWRHGYAGIRHWYNRVTLRLPGLTFNMHHLPATSPLMTPSVWPTLDVPAVITRPRRPRVWYLNNTSTYCNTRQHLLEA